MKLGWNLDETPMELRSNGIASWTPSKRLDAILRGALKNFKSNTQTRKAKTERVGTFAYFFFSCWNEPLVKLFVCRIGGQTIHLNQTVH